MLASACLLRAHTFVTMPLQVRLSQRSALASHGALQNAAVTQPAPSFHKAASRLTRQVGIPLLGPHLPFVSC